MGGIQFSKKDILAFLSFDGFWIRKVVVPEGEVVAEIPVPPEEYKAKRIILGPRRKIDLQVIKKLVEEGADIHTGNDCVLMWAADKGYLDIVEYLVEREANVHAHDDYAVIWAAENGYLDMVEYLVSKGADIHAENDLALRLAAENGYLEVAKFLLKKAA